MSKRQAEIKIIKQKLAEAENPFKKIMATNEQNSFSSLSF